MEFPDISEFQAYPDFNIVLRNLKFIFVRIQDGNTHYDKHANRNIAAIAKGPIPYGVYAFHEGESPTDSRGEARDCYNRTKRIVDGCNGRMPIMWMLDEERQGIANPVNNIIAFIDELKKLSGDPVGLYSGAALWASEGLDNVHNSDFKWLASYGLEPSVSYDVWQYTDAGHVPGIYTPVDMNKNLSKKFLGFIEGKKGKTPGKHSDKSTTPDKTKDKTSKKHSEEVECYSLLNLLTEDQLFDKGLFI